MSTGPISAKRRKSESTSSVTVPALAHQVCHFLSVVILISNQVKEKPRDNELKEQRKKNQTQTQKRARSKSLVSYVSVTRTSPFLSLSSLFCACSLV